MNNLAPGSFINENAKNKRNYPLISERNLLCVERMSAFFFSYPNKSIWLTAFHSFQHQHLFDETNLLQFLKSFLTHIIKFSVMPLFTCYTPIINYFGILFLHSYVILSYAAGINNRRLKIGNDGFIADQASKYEQLPTN